MFRRRVCRVPSSLLSRLCSEHVGPEKATNEKTSQAPKVKTSQATSANASDLLRRASLPSSTKISQGSPIRVVENSPCEDESVPALSAPLNEGKQGSDWSMGAAIALAGGVVTIVGGIIAGIIKLIEFWEKATFDSEIALSISKLASMKVSAPEDYAATFAQHLPGGLKEKLKNDRQSWLVLLGVKGTGKTSTAKEIARLYDGPSLFVSLETFKEDDSLAKILFTELPRNDQGVLKGREREFAERVLEKASARVTIVLDLIGVAAQFSTVHLDKQIKALTEICGVRVIVAASEGTQWMSLNEEPRRKVVFFHTLPKDKAEIYYDQLRQEAVRVNPTWKATKEQKQVVMDKGKLVFPALKESAMDMEDGGVQMAESHYSGYKRDIAAVLEGTCPENHRRSFAQKLAEGEFGRDDLYKVCGGNFKVLAEKANMRVEDWFAQEFVVPNIAFLPDAGRQYGAQSNVVKSILMTIY